MTSDEGNQATTRPTGNSRPARIVLLAFIISPLAVLTLLCVLIARSIDQGREMNEPPVGAGAGKTGMSNEYMRAPAPKP